MKLQIDTLTKTIGILENVTIKELNEFIRLAIPESEWDHWKINTVKELVPNVPIIIDRWREQPWGRHYPWWEQPATLPNPIWYEVNTGTGAYDVHPPYTTCFTVELK